MIDAEGNLSSADSLKKNNWKNIYHLTTHNTKPYVYN